MRIEDNPINLLFGVFSRIEEQGSLVVLSASGHSFSEKECLLWDSQDRDYIRNGSGQVLVFDHLEEAEEYALTNPYQADIEEGDFINER